MRRIGWLFQLPLVLLALHTNTVAAATLRWANQADALSLDPHANNETMTLRFLGNVYDALVARDREYKIVPWIASEWQLMEPSRWRFVLRKDVHFAEGELLTADDVIFSLQRAGSASSGVTAQAAGIDHVDKIDDHTVDIVTKGPRPTLLNELCSIYIMSQSWSLKNGASEVANNNQNKTGFTTTHANGTGPYRIVERTADQRTVLKEVTGWWGKKDGNVTDVIFTPIKNSATRLAALLSGEVDLIQPVPVQNIAALQAADNMQILQAPEIRTIYLGMDNAAPTLTNGEPNPMRDRRVREALYRAIDEDGIAKSVMRGIAVPTALFVPAGVGGYDRALDQRYPYDVAMAKSLMEQAGYPQGFAITMECPNDRYVNDEAICTAVASMFARIGVKATVNAQTKSIYLPYIQTHRVDMYLQGWGSNSFDAYEAFFYNLATRYDEHPAIQLGEGQGQFNIGRYSNPKLDALLLEASRTIDPAARQGLISQVHQFYKQDIPSIPLHQQIVVWAARKGVSAVPYPDDSVTLRWISINK